MPVQIAIIDDGVNEKLYNSGTLCTNIEITPDNTIQQRNCHDPFMPSHGTSCAAIIKRYAPAAVISSIKILSDSSKTSMRNQLVKALKWCSENNVQLINLSLGTIDFRDFAEIRKVADELHSKGIIMVAACNNRNVYTVPAALPTTIGVKCDIGENLQEGEFVWNSFAPDGIEITACGRHFIKKYTGEGKATNPCNSFAAPMITGIVHNIMAENPGICFNSIKNELQKLAVKKGVEVINPFTDDAKLKEIDVPVIAIYSQDMATAAETAKKLFLYFRQDGYYAVAAAFAEQSESGKSSENKQNSKNEESSENEGNILCVKDFCTENNSSEIAGIRRIYSIYDADVMLIGVDNSHTLSSICYELDVDIKIIIKNHSDASLYEIIREEKEVYCINCSISTAGNNLRSLYYDIKKLFAT